MANLYFYYSAMNAGKSAHLIQSAFNYREKGMHVLCFLPDTVFDALKGTIKSRTGITLPAVRMTPDMNVQDYIARYIASSPPTVDNELCHEDKRPSSTHPLACIFVDEAQFLSKHNVSELCAIVDQYHIPVLCYGLRTDFQGHLFTGSHHLLAWADHLKEIKTICHCGLKATMTLRLTTSGDDVDGCGPQVAIGGNERYVSVCRTHHTQKQWRPCMTPSSP